MIPFFLELTTINRNSIYVNMSLVHKIAKSDNWGSVLYIGENQKQITIESPDLIMQMMYTEEKPKKDIPVELYKEDLYDE